MTDLASLPPLEELSYEQAFAALEMIVSALESEKRPLDEALALFERGQALVQRCTALLDQAELRVRQLSQGNDETLTDFAPQA